MPDKTPSPRAGHYFGMRIINVDFPDGTWLEGEEFAYPEGGFTRRFWAACEDGKMRQGRCSIPDTYFSIPARVVVGGKRINGYVTSDETGLKFKEVKHANHTTREQQHLGS